MKNGRALIFLAILLVAIGFLIYKKPNNLPKSVIKVAAFQGSQATGLEIARVKEYFKDEGLDVEIDWVRDDKYIVEKFQRGEIDFYVGGINAGLFNAFARGNKIYMVADAGHGPQEMIFRKDLWDNGTLRSIKDFKGKIIRIGSEGAPSFYGATKTLAQYGLTLGKDVKTINLTPEQVIAGFESKKVDGGGLPDPYRTKAVENGLAVISPEKGVNRQLMGVYASDRMVSQKRDQLRSFLRAYLKGVDFYEKARAGKQPERKEQLVITAKFTESSESMVEKFLMEPISKDGRPLVDSVKDMYKFFREKNVVTKDVDIDEFIRLEFLPK